ncbi:MAG: GAF domain-containing sensor histidine kinase [Anaerolineae bacterium]|nr:GAF domain-containing sensor histidine kinase [Anaerolineae bacterium]MDW8173962.1 GAF domain-containing sensor histidine kinase [Anaerolineae bacterium]
MADLLNKIDLDQFLAQLQAQDQASLISKEQIILRIDAINQAARYAWYRDLEQAQAWAEEAYQRSLQDPFDETNPYLRGLAYSLTNLAHIQYRRHSTPLSRARALDALSLHAFNGDQEGQVWSLIVLAIHDLGSHNWESMDQLIDEALALQPIPFLLSRLMELRGKVRLGLNDPEGALRFFREARSLIANLDDRQGLGSIHDDIATCYNALGRFDDAIVVAEQGLDYARQMGDAYSEAKLAYTLGVSYLKKDDHFRANEYFEMGAALARENQNVANHLQLLLQVAEARRRRGLFQTAIMALNEVVQRAQSIQASVFISKAHEALARVYAEMGAYDKAYQHHVLFHECDITLNQALAQARHENALAMQRLEFNRRETLLYQQRNQQLAERVRQMKIVLQVTEEVAQPITLSSVMLLALDSALRLSGARAGFVALLNETQRCYEVAQIVGDYNVTASPLLPDLPPLAQLSERLLPIVQHIEGDDGLPTAKGSQMRILLPLVFRGHLLGFINVETNKPDRFDEDALQMLTLIASAISSATDNARLYDQIQTQLRELQKAHEQVSQLEQLKTDMIRIAAHDLKNPLSIIIGYGQLLEDDFAKAVPQRYVQYKTILQAANRMQRLVNDILSLERIEQMAQAMTRTRVDLLKVVERVLKSDLEQLASGKAQSLTWKHDQLGQVLVLGDEAQLYEAVYNLVSNAIKYTPQDGQIQVSLRRERGKWAFRVQDNGYGIADELKDRLFQPFFRAVSNETRGIDGTGLGLHLVHNIVKRHNGSIIFASQQGKGSTFGFFLPSLPDA